MLGCLIMGLAQIHKGDDNMNTYYKLTNGDLISKRRVDDAIALLDRLRNGFSVVELTDMEMFTKGNIIEAAKRFSEKHDINLLEAKYAIDFLREEGR